MKKNILFLAILMFASGIASAQKKSGIINFSFRGKDQQANYSASSGSPEMPPLYFIYDRSTKMDTSLTSDIILRHTEKMLGEFLGYPLTPVDTKTRPSGIEQMDGAFWVMESITEKNAFNKLGYDEVIKVDARIYSGGSRNGKQEPVIEVSVKVIDKDGKTTFKNNEKIRLKGELIPQSELVMKDDGGGATITFGKGIKLTTGDGGADNSSKIGLPGAKIYDWYQQCLSNVLIKK